MKIYILHFTFYILLLFLSVNLKAEDTPLQKIDRINENLIYTLNQLEIPENVSFVLYFRGRETHEINTFTLQEMLINHGFRIVESEEFADFSIVLGIDSRDTMAKVSRRNVEMREYSVFIHVVNLADTEVLSINRFSFQERLVSEPRINNKWYSPFLITFVISSLIYLLYFGM